MVFMGNGKRSFKDMIITCGVITVSDRSAAGIREDRSGPALVERIHTEGGKAEMLGVVPDEEAAIQKVLRQASDTGEYDLILTTGGTGFAPRDVTPEATREIIDREAPGMAEIIRAQSYQITPHAMLSRGIAGIRKRTLIINLPGSPKAALESLDFVLPVLPHAVKLLREAPDAEEGHQFDQT
jgi:molybdenum cofactor synthesis domain-containing protein